MNAKIRGKFEAYSAGTRPAEIDPNAIKAMKEIGIDISNHRSKVLIEFKDWDLEIVVTACSNAAETCPFFPGGISTGVSKILLRSRERVKRSWKSSEMRGTRSRNG